MGGSDLVDLGGVGGGWGELEGDLVGGEMKGVRWGEGLSAGNFVF